MINSELKKQLEQATKEDDKEEKYSKEIIDKLLELTKKEKHISLVSSALELSDYELIGLARDLRDVGYNIIVKQFDDGFHIINQGDTMDMETSTYTFETDESNEFKFVAISDLRLGANNQQLSILQDIYRKAQEMGIHNVIICGNISAGLKPISDNTNFVTDTQAQIDYIAANFPKVEGIKTYFISGKLDDKHLRKKNINIGKRIADLRPDMVYLGEDVCDITIDRVKMQIMSAQLAKTYTVSYRVQQTIDAVRSEDKPDIFVYGGLMQMEKFSYRGVKCLSVPSVYATDKEMQTKRYANTIGAWYATVKTDDKGKLKSFNAVNAPYYQSAKNKGSAPVIKLSTSGEKPSVDQASIDTALKFLRYARNGMSIDAYMAKFGLNYKELQGLLFIWEMCGKGVELEQSGSEIVFKKNSPRKQNFSKASMDDLTCTEILAVSDTHFGNKLQQVHLLNALYQEAYNRGIRTALHIGDLTDGNYPDRKENARLQHLKGFDEQVGFAVDWYPRIDGMETHYILGSHDETHFKNGQATVEYWLSKCRPDMHFLGQDTGAITINGVKFVLDHPGGGSSQALSYKPQKRIEILESHTKPNVLLIGHYHKSYHFVYRNVQCIEVPALCFKTQFQQKQGLINSVGGYFIKVYADKKGHIQYFEPEEVAFGPEDFWDEAGKDKNKVKKLVISKGIY